MMDISFLAIGPAVVLVLGAIAVLMIDVFSAPPARVHGVIVAFTLAVAGGLAWFQWQDVDNNGARPVYDGFLQLDKAGVYVTAVLLVVVAFGTIAAWQMLEALGQRLAEGVSLILLAASGFVFMGSSSDLVMIFVALEIGSISLYILAGIVREKSTADEAAIKYFLLGAFASAIFIYGGALTYAGTGSTNLIDVTNLLSSVALLRPGVVLVAMALLIIGLAFKVTAAPFHSWAPDVYQGVPAGAVGFMAAAAKIGGFAAMVRVLMVGFSDLQSEWSVTLAAVAALSVVLGTLFAIQQSDLRRLLAYSGVAHAGFILTGVTAGLAGLSAVWFYLGTYVLQLIAAFAIVAVLGGGTTSGFDIDDLAGLGTRQPFLAAVLATMMLAMSGLPLTAGFVSKFGVFTTAWAAGFEWLVIVGLLASVAGFYFYLRAIVLMYFQPATLVEAPGTAPASPAVGPMVRAMLIAATAVTLFLGFFPGPLLDLVAGALPF
jgi:NADH-quinone oxidoreductase subunit N